MTFIYKYKPLFTKILLGIFISTMLLSLASAGPIMPTSCDPSQTDPKASNFCGQKALLELIGNITEWINLVIIPLAVIMIAFGGFMILTAAGSTERVKKGKDTMTIAIIGVLISLGSYFIIKYIIILLGANINIEPTQ